MRVFSADDAVKLFNAIMDEGLLSERGADYVTKFEFDVAWVKARNRTARLTEFQQNQIAQEALGNLHYVFSWYLKEKSGQPVPDRGVYGSLTVLHFRIAHDAVVRLLRKNAKRINRDRQKGSLGVN